MVAEVSEQANDLIWAEFSICTSGYCVSGIVSIVIVELSAVLLASL